MYTTLCKFLDFQKEKKTQGLLADVSMQTGNLSPQVSVPFARCMCICLSLCHLPAFIFELSFFPPHAQFVLEYKKSKLCNLVGHICCLSAAIPSALRLNLICHCTSTHRFNIIEVGGKCVSPGLRLPGAQGFSGFVHPPSRRQLALIGCRLRVLCRAHAEAIIADASWMQICSNG